MATQFQVLYLAHILHEKEPLGSVIGYGSVPWLLSAFRTRFNSLIVSLWRIPAICGFLDLNGWNKPDRAGTTSQKLLPLLAFRDVHGPTDDVGVSWWDFITLHSKAGVVYRGFVEFAPTVKLP